MHTDSGTWDALPATVFFSGVVHDRQQVSQCTVSSMKHTSAANIFHTFDKRLLSLQWHPSGIDRVSHVQYSIPLELPMIYPLDRIPTTLTLIHAQSGNVIVPSLSSRGRIL